MLGLALELQRRYENSTAAEHRRRKGQVFTPPEIARFMAGLLTMVPAEYCLLDPGAGTGALSAAVCERALRLRSPRRLTVHAFENDPQLVPLLNRNLEDCKRVLDEAGHSLEYVVHADDFILAASSALDGQRTLEDAPLPVRCDGVIMNPPYFKVRKESEYARRMDRIVHGQPNVYAFFLALGARLLKEHGELVAITPRSFCSGLYFRGFRRWYFDRVALDHLHLFESRTDAFREAGVLQESVITKVHRLGAASPKITVTASFGRDLHGRLSKSELPAEEIIDAASGDWTVRIPEGAADRGVIKLIESLPARFSGVGLRISTGPVVMFRAREFLLSDPRAPGSVPLLQAHNVRPFETVWPAPRSGKPAAFRPCKESLRLLLPARNYVLLKRFSAKEERRRLTAGCFLGTGNGLSHVAVENHVNYVYHAARDLSMDETFGIAAVFNSAILDRYFRTISGNTQVNATEIRSIGFPDMKTLAAIGKEARSRPSDVDSVVLAALGVPKSLQRCLAAT